MDPTTMEAGSQPLASGRKAVVGTEWTPLDALWEGLTVGSTASVSLPGLCRPGRVVESHGQGISRSWPGPRMRALAGLLPCVSRGPRTVPGMREAVNMFTVN